MPEEQKEQALDQIREELDQTVVSLKSQGKLRRRRGCWDGRGTDLEMIQEVGYCSGIENYARSSSTGASGAAGRSACSTTSGRCPSGSATTGW